MRRIIRRHRAAMGGLLLGVVLCVLSPGAMSADKAKAEDRVDSTRSMLEEWVENQRLISKDKRDLELSKEMLEERIDLVRRETEALRAKMDETNKKTTEGDKKRISLVEDNERLKKTFALLADTVTRLESRTRELLKRLPDPIRKKVEPLSQRIPLSSAEATLSVAERFQNVVGILNEVNKFNQEITVTSEVRTLPDGNSAAVTALYIGIGRAYYVGANGKVAGIGSPAPEGWVWTPANDIAPQVTEAVAILKGERVADFVQLPMEVK